MCRSFHIEDVLVVDREASEEFFLDNNLAVYGHATFDQSVLIKDNIFLGETLDDRLYLKATTILGSPTNETFKIIRHPVQDSRGGDIDIIGANSVDGSAGSIKLLAGNTTDVNAPDEQKLDAGSFVVHTGTALSGNAGSMELVLGEAVQGRAGNFSLVVNNGDTGPGGSVHLEAGNTTDVLEMGGTLVMTAGAGNNVQGGMGGWVSVTAGAAEGTEACTVEEYECWADFSNAPARDEGVSYRGNTAAEHGAGGRPREQESLPDE